MKKVLPPPLIGTPKSKAAGEENSLQKFSDQVFVFPELRLTPLRNVEYAMIGSEEIEKGQGIQEEQHKIQIERGNCTEEEIMDFLGDLFERRPDISEEDVIKELNQFVRSKS